MEEEAAQAFFVEAFSNVTKVLGDRECWMEPLAARLGYSSLHLYDKFNAMRLYAEKRAAGWNATNASEAAGHAVLQGASTVRRWSKEFFSSSTKERTGEPVKAKTRLTFDSMTKGGNHSSFFDDEDHHRKVVKPWPAMACPCLSYAKGHAGRRKGQLSGRSTT